MKASEIPTKEVIVIGNGPSAISLSYILSGNWPYYNGNPVPNEYLQYKLQNKQNTSIIEQDLEHLSEGLEGRSSNPVALLFDTLSHPNADFGLQDPIAFTWKYSSSQEIDHIVLGKGPPGGVWQTLEGGIQTVSRGNWMELPDMPFREWSTQYRHSKICKGEDINWSPDFASTGEVGQYYIDYLKNKGISNKFHNFHTVTSVRKVLDIDRQQIDCESGEMQCCDSDPDTNPVWEVCGQKITLNDCDKSPEIEDFCYRANNIVLAVGSSDTPNRLDIPGEDLPFVIHSMKELEQAVNNGLVTSETAPVVIVGAGLTAADAVLYALEAKLNVIHVFRREANDPMLIFNKLPMSMYPQYHKVHRMMKGLESHDGYMPYQSCTIKDILPDGHVLINSQDSIDIMVFVSRVVITIGARPNLSFLQNEGCNLGIVEGDAIDSKNNPVDIDFFTYESIQEPGLYAMGPLVGDNFVRFLQGGSLAITSHIWKKKTKRKPQMCCSNY